MLAAHKLGLVDESMIANISAEDKAKFDQRMSKFPQHLHKRILQMYAYPYINQKRVQEGELDLKD